MKVTKTQKIMAWTNNAYSPLITQGENGIKYLYFVLYNNENEVIDLTDVTSVIYSATKRNGLKIYNTMDILSAKEGKVSLQITSGMTDIDGTLQGEIQVITSDGVLKFYGINPKINTGNLDNGVESSNEFTELKRLSNKIATLTPEGTAIIDDEAIGEQQLADRAVTTNKIGIGAVQSENIGESAIKTDNILSGAITQEKLENKSVSIDKLADDTAEYINSKANATDVDIALQTKANNKVSVSTAYELLSCNIINDYFCNGINGIKTSATGYNCTEHISCGIGDKFKITTTTAPYASVAVFFSADEFGTTNYVGYYNMLTGSITNKEFTVNKDTVLDTNGNSITDDKLNSISYVVFNTKDTTTFQVFQSKASTTVPEALQNLYEQVEGLTTTTNNKIDNADGIINKNHLSSTVQEWINSKADNNFVVGGEYQMLSLSDTITGKYYPYTTGTITAADGYRCIKLNCVSTDKFTISTSYGYNAPIALFYSNSNTYIGYFGLSKSANTNCTDLVLDVSTADIYTADGTVITDEQRSSIAYIAVNGKFSSDFIIKKYIEISKTLNEIFNGGITSNMITDKSITAEKIADDLMSIIRNNNALYGKSLFVAGDSVAQGQGSGGYAFGEWLRDRNNMTLTKDAIGGTTIGICPSQSNPSIYERICLAHTISGTEYPPLSGSYDYIIIEGGFNDVFKATSEFTLGEISDSYDGTYVKTSDTEVDTTKTYYTVDATPTTHPRRYREVSSPVVDKLSTYYELTEFNPNTTLGALELICRYLTLNYFDTKKLFVLGHRKVDAYAVRQETYWNAMIEVLNKWGIPYVDIRRNTNLFAINEDFGSKYFAEVAGTHPLKETYLKFYVPPIEAKLKEL